VLRRAPFQAVDVTVSDLGIVDRKVFLRETLRDTLTGDPLTPIP